MHWINKVSQPHFEGSVRMKLTFPKLGLGSLLGLLKLQSSIIGVKTPCIGVFFISLESYQSVVVENGFAWAIWTSQHKLWQKERPGVKLAVWLPATKSRESMWPWCVQVDCNMALKSSWRKLQLCFRPHPNRRSEQRVMIIQSPGSPNRDSFEIPPRESQDKKPFGCGCRGEAQSVLYGGRWWLPPSPGRDESNESRVARGLS
jgi:hypothetical protein